MLLCGENIDKLGTDNGYPFLLGDLNKPKEADGKPTR